MVAVVNLVRRVSGLCIVAGLGLGGCTADHTRSIAPVTLSPPQGTQAGGQAVRIEGDDFVGHGPVSVYFGVRAAKAVVVEGPRLITVLTPQRDEPGTVPVWLRFGDGRVRRLVDGYTFEEQTGIVLRPEIGG